MIEQEYKELITEKQFQELLKEFNPEFITTQTNHYFTDKDGILSENRITVRVREIGLKFKLQIKMPISESKGLHVNKEYEEELSELPDFFDEKKISAIINRNIGRCYPLGFLTTQRHSYHWNKDTEICIDKSSYFDTVDYEIEVECLGKLDEKLKKILSKHNVNFEHECKGKYSRFLNKTERKQ